MAAHPHGMPASVPEIEIPDDADAACVRGIEREYDAGHAVMHDRMRAELVVELQMRAFVEQVQIEVGEDREEAVGILHLDGVVAEAHAQPVTAVMARDRAGKQARLVHARQLALLAVFEHDRDMGGVRHEHPHDGLVAFEMRAEEIERVGVMADEQRVSGRRKFVHQRGPSSENKVR